MLMMRWLKIIAFCLGVTNVSAQDVVYSPYEKFDLRSGDFSVIGKVGGRIYTYRSGSDGAFLHAYNDSMDKLATVMLDFFPKKIYETKFITYQNQILVLYQSVEGTKVTQHAALLDGMGRLLKGPLTLSTAKTGIFGPNRDYFSSAVSDDKKQIVIYGVEEKGKEIQMNAIWLDDQLGSIQRSGAGFRADNDLAYVEGLVDNNGNFYLPVFTPVGSKDLSDNLWVLSLPKGSRKFNSRKIPLNDLYAGSITVKLDNTNNRIYTGGFYSDKRNGNYEGVLYSSYSLSDTTSQSNRYILFDERLRTETGERNTKRALNTFDVKQMIIKKDGGFVLIAEDFFISTRTTGPGWGGYYSTYYSPFMGQNVREYNYDDVLALSYDGEGNKQWHAFVRKSQYSQEDGGVFSSYALINTGGSLGVMFNDFNKRLSRIQLATIDSKGQVEMHSLAAGSDNDPDWLPRSGKQTGLKEVVVPCLRKRQICFAKIVF